MGEKRKPGRKPIDDKGESYGIKIMMSQDMYDFVKNQVEEKELGSIATYIRQLIASSKYWLFLY